MLKKVFLIAYSYLTCSFCLAAFAQQLNQSQLKTTHTLAINGHTFQVALANNEEARARGLMGISCLLESEGMLFVFDKPIYVSFWMKGTSLPLSLAYIDSQGVIKEIYDMQPYDLRAITSFLPVLYALELPQGAFKERGIKINDHVEGLEKLTC